MFITPIIGLVMRLFLRSEGSDPQLKMDEAISLATFSPAFDRPSLSCAHAFSRQLRAPIVLVFRPSTRLFLVVGTDGWGHEPLTWGRQSGRRVFR